MAEETRRGEELFDKLSQEKKRRRRKMIRTVAILLAVVAAGLVITVNMLRKNVEARFAANAAEVQEYAVRTGTIHTVVAGSGVLTEEDLEEITTPKGVEVTEVFVEAGDTVKEGQVLASVDMATVMTALSALQEEMEDLDSDISDAKGDEVSSYITAGVSGRIKTIYAEKGMDVSVCMAEHGALAVLSLDGYLAADVEAGLFENGEEVLVTREDGSALDGKVSVTGKQTKVLVTDNGPKVGETVTISKGDKTVQAPLYIHQPLAVTGYAGTIQSVSQKENAKVSPGSSIFQLTNTAFSANYDSLLRDREEMEETLMELLSIYRSSALLAPMDGRISAVQYDEETHASTYASAESQILTLYPDKAMTIAISVDETDIMALEEGQKAQVTVSSVSEEEVFPAEVTQISKVADTSTGVTRYAAEVTLDKAAGMLSGMSAEVDIQIEGVENAMIIPIDALHQTRDMYFVYRGYNEETKQYEQMTPVTIGMQNDTQVEILSGLNVGDVIYYTEAPQDIFAFMMGQMGGSGTVSVSPERPSGGNMGGMPSGGMPSGGMPSGGMGPGMNRGG